MVAALIAASGHLVGDRSAPTRLGRAVRRRVLRRRRDRDGDPLVHSRGDRPAVWKPRTADAPGRTFRERRPPADRGAQNRDDQRRSTRPLAERAASRRRGLRQLPRGAPARTRSQQMSRSATGCSGTGTPEARCQSHSTKPRSTSRASPKLARCGDTTPTPCSSRCADRSRCLENHRGTSPQHRRRARSVVESRIGH